MRPRISTKITGWAATTGTVALLLCGTLLGEEQAEICRYCQQGWRSSRAAIAETSGRMTKYAPDRQVDVQHIRLDVTPDFTRHTVAGTTRIEFTPISQPLTDLRLDAVDLTVSAVRGSSDIASYVNSGEDLTVVFAEPIPVGTSAWIEVDHEAEPKQGFYFRTPEMGYPDSDTHVWTQGQTHEARHWFPCFDYPNERSSSEVICHVPKEMTVLSNGEKIAESFDESTQLKSVQWLQEKPHANYLICLVAGNLKKLEDQHRDVPLAFYTQPTLAEHAANSFADTADIMAFYEDEIGVPFPWNKYYQVTIRDFTAGGMENTTLTTLTHRTVFAKDTENIRSTRGLDAHEMAHQWFGDYVTCKDWSHLWLNEGFATYYSMLHEGHQFGRDALLYSLYRSANDGVLPQGEKDKRPIVYSEYQDPGEQFDYRSYPKGAWVLHMLRSQLGEELYRKCIRTYLERHALTSVVTEELNAVIEEVSGRSFDPFFDQWVYHARHPDLKITYRWLAADRLAQVTIVQTQTVDEHVRLFSFPTRLRFFLADGQIVDREIEVRDREHDFFVSLPQAPKIVRFDPEYTVLARVNFAKPEAMLLAQLENPTDVIGRLQAIEGLARRKTHRSVEALTAALQHDPFYGVRATAAKALQKIGTDEAFEGLLASRSQDDARVRLAVVENLGRFYREEAGQTMQSIVVSESNPAIAAAALGSLAKYQTPDAAKLIRQSLRSESFGNDLATAAIVALRKQADSAHTAELLEVLRDRQSDFSRGSMAVGLDTLARLAHGMENKDAVREYLQGLVADSQSPLRTAAISALGTLGDPKSLALLQDLSDDREDRVARVAKQAAETLEKERTFVPSEVVEVRQLLRELKQSQIQLEKQLDELRAIRKEQSTAPSEAEVDEPETADKDLASQNEEAAKPRTNDNDRRRAGRRRRPARDSG